MKHDDEVKKLAKTLKDSGLASSDEDAMKMAEGMVKEEDGVVKKIKEEDEAKRENLIKEIAHDIKEKMHLEKNKEVEEE